MSVYGTLLTGGVGFSSIPLQSFVSHPNQDLYPFSNEVTKPSQPKVSSAPAYDPVPIVGEQKGGTILHTFGQDWYNRIHIDPAVVDVGNLMSLQTREILLWNAYFVPKTVESIVIAASDSGVELQQPVTTPFNFSPLQYLKYKLTVSLSGPPSVDAKYQFIVDGENPTLTVKGNRVVVWPFVPQSGAMEALEWKTDIIRAKAAEQRMALRKAPRQSFDHTYILTEHEAARARAMAFGWGKRNFGAPVWSDKEFYGRVSSGETILNVDTTIADYRVGECLILWQDSDTFEAISIESMTDSSITLSIPVTNDIDAAYIMPMRYAWVPQGVTLGVGPHHYISASVSFSVSFNADLSSDISLPKLHGLDILTDTQYYLGEFNNVVVKNVYLMDNGIGAVFADGLYPETSQTFVLSWNPTTREDLWRIRKWLHTRKGKQKSFWLPAPSSDLTLMMDAQASSDGIVVKSVGFGLYYTTRAIQITRTDGTKTFHFVLGGSSSNGVDTLSLESALGVDTPISSVEKISFMNLVRLDTDRVEIQYEDNYSATIKAAVIEVNK